MLGLIISFVAGVVLGFLISAIIIIVSQDEGDKK